MSTPSCLPPFSPLAIRLGMFELSNILTAPKWLEFYIRLIPSEMLGGRLSEAQREESLKNISGDNTRRRTAERIFMEDRRGSVQAIDYVQQRWIIPLRPIEVPTADYVSISATPRCAVTPPIVVHSAAAAAYSAAAQQKCESWLRRQHTDLTPSNKFFSIESDLPPNALAAGQLAHAPEQRTSVFVNCNPSFRLCSTWVTLCVHEAFDEARKVELSTEAGLMATYLDIERYYSHHRNAKSELLYLRAKMLRAKAEVEVFALAIENASSPHSTYFQSVLPEQVHICKERTFAGSINDRTDSTYGNSLAFVSASIIFDLQWVPGTPLKGVTVVGSLRALIHINLVDRKDFVRDLLHRTAARRVSNRIKMIRVATESTPGHFRYEARSTRVLAIFRTGWPLSFCSTEDMDKATTMDKLDIILNSAFLPDGLDARRDTARYEIREISQKPEMILPEVLHEVAYVFITSAVSHSKSTTSLASLVVLIITLALQVINLCCINISVPPTTLVASTEFAQLYLAFEGVGVDDEDVFTLATIKGMYSRLYTHPESVSALRTMENGIDRDHLRTLVTSHHTCNSPSHLDCDSLNHPHHPSPTNNAHLAMKAARILSLLATTFLSRNRWSHVMEATCTHPLLVALLGHHPVMRQREVTPPPGAPPQARPSYGHDPSPQGGSGHGAASDYYNRPPPEGQSAVTFVHSRSRSCSCYQPQPPSEFDEEVYKSHFSAHAQAYGSGHDDKPMANDDIGTAAAIEALKITAANNQEDHRMDSKLTRTLRMQGHLPDHKVDSRLTRTLSIRDRLLIFLLNQLKSSLVMALESRAVEVKVKDLCRKLPVHSRKTPVTEMTTTYDK
ncbi:hypothetical protein DEU56DRAFT_759708 [Suillus clintonianus]|uniref:uncharacterized protein n=1 Tax=Suillus clintonianus TaxID=1904413 RepID=UPI001B8840E0|nr:uncharacterized protein DEU56DRAFT_759708 [Suillus clintonianus]KAG2124458.1 hypothetical protein DEU56DRAFT_759708 [Suillus clintonianus]